MKLICHLIGLLIMGLVATLVTADISLILKNLQYLPPVQGSQISNNHKIFENPKYGNAKYDQFEVQNQLASRNERTLPRNPGGGNNKNNHNSLRLTKEIRIEHINAPPGFPLDDPDLDVSLLNVASEGGNNQIILKHDNVPTSSPLNVKIPVSFPSENFENFVASEEDLKSYRPTTNIGENLAVSDSFQSSEYSTPLNTQQLESAKYSHQDTDNAFKESDFLPPPQLPESHNNDVSQFTVRDNLPPHGVSDPQTAPFKPSQYLPPDDANNPFKGPDYLPPQQISAGQQQQGVINSNNQLKTRGYLPPTQSGYNQELFHGSKPFQGADYLPPSNSNDAAQQGANHPFRGPDYLPPRRKQQPLQQQQQQQQSQQQYSTNDAGFKPSAYLPPGYDFQKPPNSEDAIAELHTLPEHSNNNQHQHQHQHHQTQVRVQSNSQVADTQEPSDIVYGTPSQASPHLPPSYDFKTPESSINSGQQAQSASAPDYFPPSIPSEGDSRTYGHQGYLPPRYDFQKPLETQQQHDQNYQEHDGQHQQRLPQSPISMAQPQNYHRQTQHFGHQNEQATYKGPGYLPPTNLPHAVHPTFKGPGYLPPTPKLPLHSAQQSSQVYNGPGYLPPTGPAPPPSAQQSGQGFKRPDFLPSNVIPQAPDTQTFQAPGYLPPTSASHIFSNSDFKGSDYLPPVPSSGQHISQQSNFKAPGYLPPNLTETQSDPVPHSTYVHPLSSYMSNVQPFERYGSTRKPFPDYGPPPTQVVPTIPNTEVAPMYKEAASRPQYYAPAMSYATNAISSQAYNSNGETSVPQSTTLRQQAREALQTFMPQDVRQGNTHSSSSSAAIPKVPTSTPTSARIRTVQIVNTNEVKTLKVLESLDHTGVKTIKILGPSNETPMGEHRVVKVISGHEQTVQTVKIYNDHQDYTPGTPIASAPAPARLPSINDYLPSRRKRNSKKLNAKGRRRITRN